MVTCALCCAPVEAGGIAPYGECNRALTCWSQASVVNPGYSRAELDVLLTVHNCPAWFSTVLVLYSQSSFVFLSILFCLIFFHPLVLFLTCISHICSSPGVAASSFFTSGKYAIDPELRGTEFERLTQNLDVHFWKAFWNITETEVLSVSRMLGFLCRHVFSLSLTRTHISLSTRAREP